MGLLSCIEAFLSMTRTLLRIIVWRSPDASGIRKIRTCVIFFYAFQDPTGLVHASAAPCVGQEQQKRHLTCCRPKTEERQ